ncbi:hypothetical protein OH77DRAFT_312211 [Trametes cingulata]|nr:hypothetical protein OH77DRAFT_312211 [Trametes cingulata]
MYIRSCSTLLGGRSCASVRLHEDDDSRKARKLEEQVCVSRSLLLLCRVLTRALHRNVAMSNRVMKDDIPNLCSTSCSNLPDVVPIQQAFWRALQELLRLCSVGGGCGRAGRCCDYSCLLWAAVLQIGPNCYSQGRRGESSMIALCDVLRSAHYETEIKQHHLDDVRNTKLCRIVPRAFPHHGRSSCATCSDW